MRGGQGTNFSTEPWSILAESDVLEYLAEKRQDYVTDKTNFSEDYSRNRVRLNLIPEMKKQNPALVSGITRMSENLRSDSDYLENEAVLALEKCKSGKGYAAAEIARLPAPIKSRVVKMILRQGGIEPSALRINTVLGLLEKRSARYNPCKNRFFTIRKGICFVEEVEQNFNHRNEKRG